MPETLRYCRIREVKAPTRAHNGDAGIDFFVPEDLTREQMAQKIETTGDNIELETDSNGKIISFVLKPNESVLIPSGVILEVPEGYMLRYSNKSGVAAKKHLLVGSEIVDFGYQGECHINLHNVSSRAQKINAGDKIVQGILIPVSSAMPEEVKDKETLFGSGESARGTGGFGSSGTK